MKLIVDTNRLIAALIRDSASRWLLIHLDAELIAIPFSKTEVKKHEMLILQKANITHEEFSCIVEKLYSHLVALDDEVVESKMKEAKKIMEKIDPNDTPFIAAALATAADIWSDDKHFKSQKIIKVWTTADLMKYVG